MNKFIIAEMSKTKRPMLTGKADKLDIYVLDVQEDVPWQSKLPGQQIKKICAKK